MYKIPWLNILAAAVIGWVAGQMLIHDSWIQEYLTTITKQPLILDGKLVAMLCAIGVLMWGFKLKNRII
jgi:predicted tellurium resistance membrane protein TerC